MEMNLINSNFKKGVVKIQPSEEEDDLWNGVDGWIDEDIPIAFRDRPNLTINHYKGKVITIRIAKPLFQGYINFEYDKMLNGQFKAIVYFFKFKGHLLVCPVQAIIDYLKSHPLQELEICPNRKGKADLIVIHPHELKSALIIPLTLELPFNIKEE